MGTWPVPFEERDVSTSFGSTHIVVTGHESAPPLVLLHGANTTAVMWGPVIAPLSSSYRCYCVDTITDANKSVATTRVRGVAEHVGWLREVFSVLDIDSARVAGLSYGGWLAALLAVHAPELVERLVVLAPAGTFTRLTTEFMVRMFGSSVLRSPFLARRSIQWLSSTPDASSVLTDDQLRRISAPTTVMTAAFA